MRKRRFIGVITILTGLAGLGAPLALFLGSDVSLFLLVMTILAFVLRGVAGTVGGILLWRGSKLGHQLSAACWTYLVIVGVVALFQLFTGPLSASFAFVPENKLFWQVLSKSVGKLIWGLPILYILIRGLRTEGTPGAATAS